jgi:hypothetical protein
VTDDLEATAALLREAHPDADRFRDARFLQWLYRENPLGPAIAEDVDRKGRRVAHFALVPQPYRNAEQRAAFVLSVNAVTRSGLGSMHFVALAARGTRRAVELRDELGGLIGGIGVTNDASTMPGLHRIGARLVASLPVTVGVTGRRRPGVESHRVTSEFLASDTFTALATGLDDHPARGWTQCWTVEQLRWRLSAPGVEYGLHADDEVVAVTTRATAKGVPVTVVLKLLPRGAPRGRSGGRAVVAAACRHHRTPLWVHAGWNAHVGLRGIPVPKRAQPAPLNLLFIARDEASAFLDADLGQVPLQAPAEFDTFELLDFDAF